MFWQSTLSMAMIDALVLGISMMAMISLIKHRKSLSFSGSFVGLICITAGIVLFALFYGTDFILVAVLPHLIPAEPAGALIERLHPDTAWAIGSYGLVLIIWGFLFVIRHTSAMISSQHQTNADLNQELEARRAAEVKLQKTQDQLHQKVESLKKTSEAYERRGNELATVNEDLIVARDQAEDANRCKSEFLALMSHELRTPLNAVIGFSEMIKDETFGPVGSIKYREYATDIHSSGRHLLQVINDILDLSKVEAGAEELIEEITPVGEVSQAAMTLVRGRADRGGVKLELLLPEQPLALIADQRKIKQILINLLSNSVKYTQSGGRCSLSVRGDHKTGVEFEISDTGIGIASDDIPNVLSQFGQVQNSLNRKLKGSGLGLPLTKSFIEMHGGTLKIESKVGLGTTVTVSLPPERVVDPAGVVDSMGMHKARTDLGLSTEDGSDSELLLELRA